MEQTIKCYGRVRNGNWQQEWYETASRDARRRAMQLRKAGYNVIVSTMGEQVTPVGRVKMTLLTVMNVSDEMPDVTEIRI